MPDPRHPEGPHDHDAPEGDDWDLQHLFVEDSEPGPAPGDPGDLRAPSHTVNDPGVAGGDVEEGYVDEGYVDERGYESGGYVEDGYVDERGYESGGYDDWDDGEFVPLRTESGGRSRWLVAALVFAGILLLGVLAGGMWVRDQIDPGDPGDPVELTIPTGATTADIARLLEDKGIIGNPTVFEWYLRVNGGGPFLAGDYDGLRENMAMGDVVDILDAGPLPPDIERITIREGLWLSETRQLILDTFPAMTPEALDLAFFYIRVPGLPEIEGNPEGVLFPATYDVQKSTSNDPATLIDQMVAAFEAVAQRQGLYDAPSKLAGAAGDRVITPYEALIVASMVEAEARTAEDRPKIARVIYNRLADGMRLDIDATVLYALGDRLPTLTQSQLEVDSPYNTRRVAGIPPTPINSPGEASIEAALNPAEGDWRYYVLADEDGSHYFTDDFDDFNQAVAESREKGLL